MNQSTTLATVYLASPLGFAESTRAYMDVLVYELETLGLRVVNPWTLPDNQAAAEVLATASAASLSAERLQRLKRASEQIAAANERALRAADLVVAVLDGVDVDSGTAAEIGFAAALGHRVFGLRTDIRRSGEVEGLAVNLQVQWWIEHSGGVVARALDELAVALRATLQ